MIAIVDYGRGNLGSVQKALAARRPSASSITEDPAAVARPRALVVPGRRRVRATRMERLERLGLSEPIRAHIEAGPAVPRHLPRLPAAVRRRARSSGHAQGAGHPAAGVVRRFPRAGLKVPHMGWNRLWHDRERCRSLAGVPDGAYFYFVHSYYPDAVDASGGGLVATASTASRSPRAGRARPL